jgi:hypothetical protein
VGAQGGHERVGAVAGDQDGVVGGQQRQQVRERVSGAGGAVGGAVDAGGAGGGGEVGVCCLGCELFGLLGCVEAGEGRGGGWGRVGGVTSV